MYGIRERQQKNIFIIVQVYRPPHCSDSRGALSDRDDMTFELRRTTEFLRSRFQHRPGRGCNKATATSPMDDVALVLFCLSPIVEFTFNPLWRPPTNPKLLPLAKAIYTSYFHLSKVKVMFTL